MGRKRAREGHPETGRRGNREKQKLGFSSLPSVATFLLLLRLSVVASPVAAFSPPNQHNAIFASLLTNEPSSKRRRCFMSTPEIDGGPSRTWNQRPDLPASSSQAAQNGTNRRRRQRKPKPIPVTGYNGKEIEDYYDRRPFQVGWRLNILGFPLLGTFFDTLLFH